MKTPQSIIRIKHNISLLQYKYWVLLLKEYREQYERGDPCDENGFRYLPMSKLVEYIGYEPKRSEIWSDLLALKNESIAYNFLEKDKTPAKYGAGFVSEWVVTNSYVGFKLPSFLEEVMRGLDDPHGIFQLINWDIFNHFSRKYEAVIYKLCRDYVGVRQTPHMSIDDFRKYMGVRPDEYADFRRLGQWVIYGPCKAINGSPVADITVEPKIDRDGRKAVGISFAVDPKPQALVPFIEAEKEPLPAFRLAKVPILAEAQAKYLALRSAEEIALCIERANQYGEKQAKDGKPPNYGALYHTAIKEGWHFALADKKATEESALAQKKARATAKRQEAAERKAQAEKGLAESEAVLGRFKSLPEAVQAETIAAFLATDPSARGAYKRKGFNSPLFLFPFAHYLKEQSA